MGLLEQWGITLAELGAVGRYTGKAMMKRKIRTPCISGWFTLGIPLILFFLLFIGLPILVTALLGWNIPEWLGISLYGLGCLPGIGVNVAIYPFLMNLAKQGQGEVTLDGDRIRWHSGRRWHEVDLSQPYWAEIAAGTSGLGEANASITFKSGGETFHLRGAVLLQVPLGNPASTSLHPHRSRGCQRDKHRTARLHRAPGISSDQRTDLHGKGYIRLSARLRRAQILYHAPRICVCRRGTDRTS